MSNPTVSTRFFETYAQRRDVEGCRPLFAADAVINTSTAPAPLDFDGYAQVGYAFLNGFADLKAEILDQFAAGDRVVSRVAWSGTHTGDLQGIPPTGRSFRGEAIVIDRVVDGRIQERWDVSNLLSMMQQLGVIPS